MAGATVSEQVRSTIAQKPYDLLQPAPSLYNGIADYLKSVLDPLAADVSAVQQARQQEQRRRKRKRGQSLGNEDVLRLKSVHHEGYGPAQVWEQARRVIEAARNEAERGWNEAQARHSMANGHDSEDDEEEVEESDMGEEGVDYEVEGVDSGDEQYVSSEDEEGDEDGDVDMNGHDDFDDIDMEDDIVGEQDYEDEEPAEEFVSDKFGLNDGFFSIDDFNRRSEFLEQQDARGDDDGAASDEEDVDWDANPLGQANGQAADNDADEDEEDEEDGPTFGDPDAESEDEDMEIGEGDLDGMDGMANTNNVMYTDFFAPPASKKKKNKKGPPNPHNFPAASKKAQTGQDEDVERTMAAVSRDLFEDENSAEEEDEPASDEELDPTNPMSRRSAHERRKAALAEEIRKLEAANVAKREWTLQGEARAADRPVNSLLEQDLDFERTGKPVPVITAELNESIEDLIKRRILAHDFNDIIRRRPDDLATGNGRRGRVDIELSNEKSQKGLAEEYEEEYQRRNDPNFVDARDEKTKKEEAEILAMWEQIRTDLDGLSSWNFRPKVAKPMLDIRVDAPTVTMEDARPSVAGEGGEASALAPQEVFRVEGVKGEVVGKSGLAKSKEEMDREEKTRVKRREKERSRKANQNQGVQESQKSKDKKNVVGDLKRGGVKVIGKKGEVQDIDGNAVKAGGSASGQGAGRYKL